MKTLLARWLLLLLLLVSVPESRSEIVTLFKSGTPPQATSTAYTNTYALQLAPGTTNPPATLVWVVTVRSNEVVKLIGGGGDATTPTVVCTLGGSISNFVNYMVMPQNPFQFVFVGPLQFGISPNSMPSACATFSITRNDDFTGPQNTVAIPADAAGPVTVKMETSTNLVEWLPSNPGSYGVSSAMRYFRLRAVRDIP